VHCSGEPPRRRCSARGRQAWVHTQHGGHAHPRPRATAPAPAEAACSPSRRSQRFGFRSLGRRKERYMCRWLAYSGTPVLLEELLYKPAHSLIDQSLHSRLGAETTNGDGFGVGWYGEGETPAVFKSI